MFKKDVEQPKLGFFSQTTMQNLQESIQKVIDCLDDEKVTCQCAEEALQVAAADLHKLFWSTTIEISKAKTFIRTWQFCHEVISKKREIIFLDTTIELDHTIDTEVDESVNDDFAKFRVKVNDRFGFTQDNPSDHQEEVEYNQHKTH